MKRKYPEYAVCFENLEKRKSGYAYNMFIASKTIIDSYCEWLFDVLFELDRIVDLSQYNDYNQRMWGFLSERLFNVWIMKTTSMFMRNRSCSLTKRRGSIHYWAV